MARSPFGRDPSDTAPPSLLSYCTRADVPEVGDRAELAARYRWLLAASPLEVNDLEWLWVRGHQLLRGKRLLRFQEVVWSTVESALLMAREEASSPDSWPHREVLAAGRDRITQLLNTEESAGAARRYLNGLFVGVLASAFALAGIGGAALGIVWVVHDVFNIADPLPTDTSRVALAQALVCIGGGAAGAVLSVILRMKDRPIGPEVRRRDAFARIVAGWFFAAVLFFLIKGGVITFIQVPTDGNLVTAWFFWGAIGMIAGFSERMATGVLDHAAGAKRRTSDSTQPPARSSPAP